MYVCMYRCPATCAHVCFVWLSTPGTGASSVLLWGGAENGTMLHDNGTSYYTLEGLTFDGNDVGGIGLLHNHSSKNNYGSLIYHVNLAFHNLTCVHLTARVVAIALVQTVRQLLSTFARPARLQLSSHFSFSLVRTRFTFTRSLRTCDVVMHSIFVGFVV